jgi:hypothetical protein
MCSWRGNRCQSGISLQTWREWCKSGLPGTPAPPYSFEGSRIHPDISFRLQGSRTRSPRDSPSQRMIPSRSTFLLLYTVYECLHRNNALPRTRHKAKRHSCIDPSGTPPTRTSLADRRNQKDIACGCHHCSSALDRTPSARHHEFR